MTQAQALVELDAVAIYSWKPTYRTHKLKIFKISWSQRGFGPFRDGNYGPYHMTLALAHKT